MNKYLLILFYYFLSYAAHADCHYQLDIPTLTYTVADINPAISAAFTISDNEDQKSSCVNFFTTFSKGINSTDYNRKARKLGSNSYISYNLFKTINSANALKGANDAISLNEVLEGTIIQNQTKTLNYYFSYNAPGSTPPIAGIYQDTILVSAFRGVFPDYQNNEKSKNLLITINVPKMASLSLLDPGGSYDAGKNVKTLNFGELTANQELSFDIRMVSNAGYQLKISSANNGTMNIAGSSDLNSKIAYNFLINNQIINLANSSTRPVNISSGSGVTPTGGALVTGKTIIQSVDGKNFGIYQDYLTLTIITTE
jgi:spore coat protein U-like protein